MRLPSGVCSGYILSLSLAPSDVPTEGVRAEENAFSQS